MAEFHLWDRTVLERFASEASDRMREQRAEITALQAHIEALQADLKAALAAYRRAVTAAAPPRPPGA